MYRTHHCGELKIENVNENITLSGWVQKIRKLGGMTFIDLRDRYGITQLVFDLEKNTKLAEAATKLGREFVIKAEGKVVERSSKNPDMQTGDIEIIVEKLEIIKASETPPFTIEAETPYLIKSTPEGARDFVVPSRLSPGSFYALPQSPQVFKQLFMVGGLDRYYQIVKCFRDEDFRADRQPEFTQIDCEMSFVTQDDVIKMFSEMAKYIFKTIKGIEFEGDFPIMSYEEAINTYGSDKPDLRFGMKIHQLNSVTQNRGFKVFDDAEYVGGICVEGASNYSRKQLDKLIDFVKKPQIGAKGLIYAKYNEDGTFKSSVDKFYSQEDLKEWAKVFDAKPGDLLLVISGEKPNSLNALNELRLEMGDRLGLRKKDNFVPLWVVDFPLLEWDEDSKRFHAMHHPFTSPKAEDLELMDTAPGKVRANAYDFVVNGVEVGGGSIRIYDNELQHKMFDLLGFTPEESEAQFGFLMEAFKYGAPPHGGAAFGLDRWVALLNGSDSIRDVIAFPKNNAGRDIMIDAPAVIDNNQLNDLNLRIIPTKEEL